MRVHNNEKPYICTYPGCFAKFAQKNNLNSHSKIHLHNLIKENNEIEKLKTSHINERKNIIFKLEETKKNALNG